MNKCSYCKKRFTDSDYRLCIICREKKAEVSRIRNLKRRLEHVCKTCGNNPPIGKSATCRVCKDKANLALEVRRTLLIAEEKCIVCQDPLDIPKSKSKCSKCLEKSRCSQRKRSKDKLLQELCSRCTLPAVEGHLCTDHYNARLYKIHCKDLQGICQNCNVQKEWTTIKLCFKCWIKKITRKRVGKGEDNYNAVMLLWEQQSGKCALSGEPLIPGLNAHLDHIVPVSKGGSCEISNMRWLDGRVNILKSNKSDEIFLEELPTIIKILQRVLERKYEQG